MAADPTSTPRKLKGSTKTPSRKADVQRRAVTPRRKVARLSMSAQRRVLGWSSFSSVPPTSSWKDLWSGGPPGNRGRDPVRAGRRIGMLSSGGDDGRPGTGALADGLCPQQLPSGATVK